MLLCSLLQVLGSTHFLDNWKGLINESILNIYHALFGVSFFDLGTIRRWAALVEVRGRQWSVHFSEFTRKYLIYLLTLQERWWVILIIICLVFAGLCDQRQTWFPKFIFTYLSLLLHEHFAGWGAGAIVQIFDPPPFVINFLKFSFFFAKTEGAFCQYSQFSVSFLGKLLERLGLKVKLWIIILGFDECWVSAIFPTQDLEVYVVVVPTGNLDRLLIEMLLGGLESSGVIVRI